MQAIVYDSYGPPEVLHPAEIPEPVPGDRDLLVRVHATTVCGADWRLRAANPWYARVFNGLWRPRRIRVLGFELAGVVAAVGARVTDFRVGDRVFGHNGFRFGAHAETVRVPVSAGTMLARMPDALDFAEAAALPFGGLAALNHLRMGGIQPGARVLIHGASGSGGTYAVQLAKHFGADVTAVCGHGSQALARELGADWTIDYTVEDIFARPDRFDLIYDAVGKLMTGIPPSRFQKLLAPGGRFVSVEKDRKDRPEDLELLARLATEGRIRPVIDRRYTLQEIVEAHRLAQSGHKHGNVVVSVAGTLQEQV